jgi:uncharacterized alkaline shock family protein YloU
MTDELRLQGIGVAPGVLETIVALATQSVEGVASEQGGLAGLAQKAGRRRAVGVTVDDDGALTASVHVTLTYGTPLHETARLVQQAVSEALTSQTGQPVSGVDVFVDAVVFDA